jgi:two-component system KDP operon response regulator KdpE
MTTTADTVLIVDDEPKIRALLRDALVADGLTVIEAATGVEGIGAALESRPQLIVLDLGLPDMDGVTLCLAVREWSTAPILVLSARHSEEEKTRLLDAGADDFVTKPFGVPELRARIRAQLRRAHMRPVPGGDTPIRVDDLEIDLAKHIVRRAGAAVHLTPTEWDLLHELVANDGRTLTHRQLFHKVWGQSYGDPQGYLRVYIAHLRRKLEADPYHPRLLLTDAGVGYRFDSEPAGA